MKSFLKDNLPSSWITILRFLRHPKYCVETIYEYYLVKKQPHIYEKILEKKKGKEKIKVAFFALIGSVWKYDYLYRLMCEYPRFEPIIVVCPVVNYGFENMLLEMDKCYEMFKQKGYNVVRTYDVVTKTYMDVKKEIHPDVVFYTNPYKGLIDDRYYITNFLDCLTCYVPYNYGNSSFYEMFNNELMHNLVWRLYVETNEHLHYSQLYANNKGKNARVTGYPGVDRFLDKKYKITNHFWKEDGVKKRIIWAPHHTFQEGEVVSYSCFLSYHQVMLDLACKYRNEIQIAFKPHPLLKVKLDSYWGKEKADAYYAQWKNMPNTTLVDGDYVDLFLSSDAMIHDCGSFIIEYLYALKPVLRMENGIDPSSEFNPFAEECLSLHYHAFNAEEIESFIKNVIAGIDSLKEKRQLFYDRKLLPPNKTIPSQNIINDLIKELGL